MTFEEALSFPDYLNYDVVFLDLRLLKEEDKGNHISNIEDFTGAKVLKKIKDINRGIQVVIFTASNKVWNIEKLLKAGANGYYIKESPEYTLNSRFSKDNYDEFIKTIKTCLSRKPLKNVYSLSCSIRQTITSLTQLGKFDQNFADSILNYLDLANKLINSADDKNDYAMSYLILFKCVEMINDKFVVQDTMGNWIISTTGTPLKQYKFSQPGSYLDVLPALFTNNQPTTFEKIAGLAFQQLGCNASFVQDMYYNIKRRNHYIHPTNTQNFTPYQLSEIEKIYCYSGYTDLLTSIKDFFQKLETSL